MEETRWRRVGKTNDDDRWWWTHEACTKRDEARHDREAGTIGSRDGKEEDTWNFGSVRQCTRSKQLC